ncbi:MAG: hypothetical protein E7341_01775 [Clostridiales bacterium]|nr:hypothetical protein [Clostridiales bacterium]
MVESRKKNSSMNLIWALIKYTISIITAFTLRTLTLKAFGDVFSGLISLYSNIISILSITELGIGTALIYKMYKPVADGDDTKVRTLTVAYKKIYYAIAGIILTLGLIIMPFLSFLTGDIVLNNGNIYYVFIFYLVNCLITYTVGHRKALLFTMQRNWVENFAMSVSILVVFPVQIYILNIVKDFYIYLACETVIKIIECLIIVLCSNKYYKKIMKAPKERLSQEDRKELVKNTYALSYSRIASTVFTGVDSIIISTCLGVVSVFLYSNYYLILTYLFSILNLVFNAVRASVGNYINIKTLEETKTLFRQLNLASFFIVCFCGVTLFCLFQPFMYWWSGLANNNMLLPLIVPLIMSIYFYVDRSRQMVQIFKETAGLFWKDRFVPLFASILNIVLSIILAFVMGIEGVILASLISVLLPAIVEIQITYKDLFKESPKRFWIDYIFKFGLFVLEMAGTFFICELIPLVGVLGLCVRIVVCFIITTMLNILIFMRTETFRGLISKLNLRRFFKRDKV